MAYEIKNKVILITGGATGIGAEVVRNAIIEEPKLIAVLDVAEEQGLSLQKELNLKYKCERVKFIQCDVSDEGQLLGAYQTILDGYGSIDLVINNAGIMNDSLNVYKKSIEVNYIALVTSTLKALEIMRKDCGGKGGTVINIASIAALYQSPILPIYFGSKSAVLQFSISIGMPEYYSRTGMRVITICFGATDTPLLTTKKLGSFDKENEANLVPVIKELTYQSAESAARGLIQAYKQGDSGSTWLVTHGEPAKDITDSVKQAYGHLSVYVS